jgi:hypothetical protein
MLGVSVADVLRLQADVASSPETPGAKATSCILIWLDGGPSHLDTFDPKPDAPREVRSQFNSVRTSVPGLHICEHLPRTAEVMEHVALIRSMTHELGNHDTGSRFLLTGHRPTPALDYPSLGSIVAYENGFTGAMPPYVAVPNDGVGGNSNGARSGYLPDAYSAFNTGNDPARVRDLHPPEGVSFARSEHRRDMLRKMDAFTQHIEEGPITQKRDAFYEQAYRLLASPQAKQAFDFSQEKRTIRERYGNSRVGTGCLLARRLVEAGVPFVNVYDFQQQGQRLRRLDRIAKRHMQRCISSRKASKRKSLWSKICLKE